MLSTLQPRLHFHLNRIVGKSRPRVVFLHLPKCGGTTINHHFKTNFGGVRTGRSVSLDSASGSTADAAALQRANAALFVCGHFGWSALEQVRKGAITFTVMREPLDRLRALYAFARKPRRIRNPAFAVLANTATQTRFEEFCLCEDVRVRAFVDNAMTRTLACDYYPFDPGDLDAALRLAKQHLETFDFVADVADLSRALPHIAEITATIPIRGEGWRNRTSRPRDVAMTREDFLRDPQLFARIAKDLELYAYARRLAPRWDADAAPRVGRHEHH